MFILIEINCLVNWSYQGMFFLRVYTNRDSKSHKFAWWAHNQSNAMIQKLGTKGTGVKSGFTAALNQTTELNSVYLNGSSLSKNHLLLVHLASRPRNILFLSFLFTDFQSFLMHWFYSLNPRDQPCSSPNQCSEKV